MFGLDTSERINTAITDIYETSAGQAFVRMSPARAEALETLRSFMFKHVYEHANKLIQDSAERMLASLYDYFTKRPEEMPEVYCAIARTDVPRAVCDYISSMTDRYAIGVFQRLFVPREAV